LLHIEEIKYDANETAVQIFPRVEAALRAKEVALPETGISLDLSSFTIVAPAVVFAALVLLGYRVKAALVSYSGSDEPWLLLDADQELPGMLARLWMLALAILPWLLSIFVVSAVALTLRAKGQSESWTLDIVATTYVCTVIVMLIAPSAIAVGNLVALRGRARGLARQSGGAPDSRFSFDPSNKDNR
jgi:hypothetical protein